jgi:hypothetical protein
MTTTTERARLGALMMDLHVVGWAGRINQDTLDLSDSANCVWAHVYGSFDRGLWTLFPDPSTHARDVVRYGFDLTADLGDDIDLEYAALTVAWLVEIRARLGNGGARARAGRRNAPAMMP